MRKRISNILVLTLVLCLFALDLYGQDFTNNTGGTYAVGSGTATLRMKSDNGKFNGSDAYGQASKVMPGTVDWTAACNAMPVGGYNNGSFLPTYYTNLATSGTDVKTFQSDIFIAGTYTPSSGNRVYTGVTVTFNGGAAQTIPGENASSGTPNGTGYYNLTLNGAGAKTINSGATVDVTNAYTQATATLTNNGTVNLGSAPGSSTADITNADGSKWNFGTGTFSQTTTFTNNAGSTAGNGVFLSSGDGAASFNNFTNTSGTFDAVSGTTINMGGSFTAAAGTITFACDANFNYNGAAQTILANTALTPTFVSYGNLTFGGTGAKTAGGDVSVCNNLTVSQETDFAPASSYTLSMLNTNGPTTPAVASYVGNVELRGNMRWYRLDNATTFTYNNANTKVKFATAPAVTEYFALDDRQQTAPANALNFTTATDVNRKIVASYTGTTGIISDLQIGWEQSDETGTFNAANNSLIRFAEGYNAAANHQTLLRTGNAYTRTIGGDPRYVMYNGGSGPGIALNGAAGGGTPRELSNNSEIILTQAPMDVISVTNGRWSNPGTWDTGLMPTAADNVHVRHVVWTGIETAVFGGAAYAVDEIDGSGIGEAGASANKIWIEHDPGAPTDPAALVIGNTDATMGASGTERLFRTRLASSANFIQNDNTTVNSGDGDGVSAAGLNGIWVRTVGSVFTPVLGTYQLNNNGSIQNNSIIEVGICN